MQQSHYLKSDPKQDMGKKDLILEFRLKDLKRFSREYKKKKKNKERIFFSKHANV